MKTIILTVICLCCLSALGQNAYILRGNQYYRQSQFELAEAQYRKALEEDPSNSAAQFNLANALQKQKKYREAIDLTTRTAANAADKKMKAQSFYNQGVAHTKLKDLEKSIESYKNALRIDPNDQQARENLQKALLEQKKQQQQQQKPQSSMSQNEAERKLKQLQQRERELQQRMRSRKQGEGQAQDW
jgi:Ca-activated chloride channel homolog